MTLKPYRPHPIDDLFGTVFEAPHIATVARRVHDGLIELDLWDLPAAAFYVHCSGSGWGLDFLPLDIDAIVADFNTPMGPQEGHQFVPMAFDPKERPPFGGLIFTLEFWGIPGVDPNTMPKYWRHLGVASHPDSVEVRTTVFASHNGKSQSWSTFRGTKEVSPARQPNKQMFPLLASAMAKGISHALNKGNLAAVCGACGTVMHSAEADGHDCRERKGGGDQ